ncbi:uncharacterized protein LOC115952546 [Quercus lobata]|uniref:Integral membrane bound transporter domain-containing protein n=1 Tax=Quercus lobata TaxID=97700 RepID=A0A7N2M7C6_QUELO|nr:uncharacterized protein LOC115952546 [Quercus lobata]
MNPTHLLWRVRLCSALRTVLACSIVGCTTLYGPETLQRLLAYPAFSYLTTILIVSDATLGDTLRSFWHAIYATIQVTILSIPSLWLVGPARFTNSLAAVGVALCTFVVALPESTHLMSKRIAFGQIVIVYVGVVIHGAQTGIIKHLIHMASSTALGVVASVLAMFFPYPRLAYNEVRKTCQLYAETASKRLDLLAGAFSPQDNSSALELVSQVKSLSAAGAKFIESIKYNLDGLLWERPQLRFVTANSMDLGEKLGEMEIPIRGMEIAVTSCHPFPIGMEDEELRNVLQSLKEQIGLNLEQAKWSVCFGATTAPERTGNFSDKFEQNLKTTLVTPEDFPASFFFYCIELLYNLLTAQNPNCVIEIDSMDYSEKQVKCPFQKTWNILKLRPTSQQVVFAFKCSVSLGLAVLFGLIYNKENGYWSGLTIAISFVTRRQATFAVANARAQGTAMGSVYGVLCCFIFHKHVVLRLLPLLPWIIFGSLLRHSQMYGQAGGVSANVGALLILGRKDYGPPSEFAIARIAEATIGLICFITVEMLVNPVRAATLAKTKLSTSLGALQDCFKDIVFAKQNICSSNFPALRERQNKLQSQVKELEKLIAEAKLEPNFWFLSFHGACYDNLLRSLSKMVDLLLIATHTIEFLSRESLRVGVPLEEFQEHINDVLEHFKKEVGSTLKCLEEVTSIKSLAVLEKELQKKNISQPPFSTNENAFRVPSSEEEVENIAASLFQHSRKVADKIYTSDGEDKLKNETILCLGGLGFSINTLMKETMKIKNEVRELVIWENPSSHIDLYEISCKVKALHT